MITPDLIKRVEEATGPDRKPTCETCAHWNTEAPDWQFDELKMKRCGAIQQRETIIEPARRLEDWDAREAEEYRLLSEAKAIAVDGSGYYAALRTRADFGCVLHSPLPKPEPEGEQGT